MGSLPNTSWYGEYPVAFLQVVRYAHKASGSRAVQSRLCNETLFVRIASITLLVLSTYSFAGEWYEEVILCVMWWFFNVATILWPMNCGPPSVITSLGKPYCTKFLKRKIITVCSIAVGNATNSTHFVTYSVATNIYDFWWDDGLIGPMKSNAQRSKVSITSYGCRGISSNCPGWPILWQLSHAWTNFLASLKIVGQ